MLHNWDDGTEWVKPWARIQFPFKSRRDLETRIFTAPGTLPVKQRWPSGRTRQRVLLVLPLHTPLP